LRTVYRKISTDSRSSTTGDHEPVKRRTDHVQLRDSIRYLFALSAVLLCGCTEPPPPAEAPEIHSPQEMAVVFDVDGTLTPKVHAVTKVRPDAAAVASALAGKGYRIVYLSARVKALSSGIPAWLSENGFPDGIIRVADTAQERRHPAAFKAGVLTELIEQGWNVQYAYGDSSTDFEAYAAVGIPRERVFALLREGKKACQPGEWNTCLVGWTEHVDFIRQSVPPVTYD
jgi:hypothetical protein